MMPLCQFERAAFSLGPPVAGSLQKLKQLLGLNQPLVALTPLSSLEKQQENFPVLVGNHFLGENQLRFPLRHNRLHLGELKPSPT